MLRTALLALLAAGAAAQLQTPAPTPDAMGLARSIKVYDYQKRSFPASIDLRGTELLPAAQGTVGFVGKLGDLDLSSLFIGLPPASGFGAEYLTYVLWAINLQGRSVNIAEIL